MTQEIYDRLLAEATEKRMALREAVVVSWLSENPGYKVSDLTLVEDTTEPGKIKFYITPKESIR